MVSTEQCIYTNTEDYNCLWAGIGIIFDDEEYWARIDPEEFNTNWVNRGELEVEKIYSKGLLLW